VFNTGRQQHAGNMIFSLLTLALSTLWVEMMPICHHVAEVI